jgi:hypothetical protein
LALDVFKERQLFRVVDVPVAKIVVIENGHFKPLLELAETAPPARGGMTSK